MLIYLLFEKLIIILQHKWFLNSIELMFLVLCLASPKVIYGYSVKFIYWTQRDRPDDGLKYRDIPFERRIFVTILTGLLLAPVITLGIGSFVSLKERFYKELDMCNDASSYSEAKSKGVTGIEEFLNKCSEKQSIYITNAKSAINDIIVSQVDACLRQAPCNPSKCDIGSKHLDNAVSLLISDLREKAFSKNKCDVDAPTALVASGLEKKEVAEKNTKSQVSISFSTKYRWVCPADSETRVAIRDYIKKMDTNRSREYHVLTDNSGGDIQFSVSYIESKDTKTRESPLSPFTKWQANLNLERGCSS